MTPGKVATWIGLVATVIAVGGWIAYAEDSHKRMRSNEAVIEKVQRILEKQQSAKEARYKQLKAWCDSGQIPQGSTLCKVELPRLAQEVK